MALTRRYRPEFPPSESASIGIDLSPILPPGVTITQATLTILRNTDPTQSQTDFTQATPTITGRQAWCLITGGVSGTDYQCRWSLTDSQSNVWNRTALLLCAPSS